MSSGFGARFWGYFDGGALWTLGRILTLSLSHKGLQWQVWLPWERGRLAGGAALAR